MLFPLLCKALEKVTSSHSSWTLPVWKSDYKTIPLLHSTETIWTTTGAMLTACPMTPIFNIIQQCTCWHSVSSEDIETILKFYPLASVDFQWRWFLAQHCIALLLTITFCVSTFTTSTLKVHCLLFSSPSAPVLCPWLHVPGSGVLFMRGPKHV